MLNLLNSKPSWPAPPVIKKPKPAEKPKPNSVNLVPKHADNAEDFCSPYDTCFVSPFDVMMTPDMYQMNRNTAVNYLQQQQDIWLRCMEVPV